MQPINRRLNSVQQGARRDRSNSAPTRQVAVSYDDAYTYALRVAYLHYLLQPKAKRKQWVPAPKPPPRTHTTNVGDLVKEFVPGNSSSVKLPHGIRAGLEKRMQGVITGQERLPGYNDAAVKKTFAQAYTAFTETGFRKSVDKDRKAEPLVLMFYSSATKACMMGHTPGDDSWKHLVDRHLALFVRMLSSLLKDQGYEQSKPELMSRLTTLENKLLTNDQNLSIGGESNAGTTIEVIAPLSYDVKDMPLVQAVAQIFGLSHSDVQSHIDAQKPNWTEEAALKDLKTYQLRLNSNTRGALRSQDFDLTEAYQEWKRAEAPQLSQMMLDILTAQPTLAKTSSRNSVILDKPLPTSPSSSTYDEDQAYADLSRALSMSDGSAFGIEHALSLGSVSLDDSPSSIRSVDEAQYTFIPRDPREFFKTIVGYVLEFDAVHDSGGDQTGPFSKQSTELLTELCVRWRLPQFTRLVVFIESATRRYTDTLFSAVDLDKTFDLVKGPPPPTKKPPHIYLWDDNLATIDRGRWTIQDYTVYQSTLSSIHDALLRELYDKLMHCYEPKAPTVGPTLFVLNNQIYSDPAFSRKEEDAADFARILTAGLEEQAAVVYRGFLDAEIPQSQEEWHFGHVVELGKQVIKLSEKIKKRYKNNPEIMGVNPLTVLVNTTFPNFENDAHDLVRRIDQVSQERGEELDVQEGFELYRELVEIRTIHRSALPDKQFSFDVEELLINYVWRWLQNAEQKADEFLDQAIKQDQFQVRSRGEGHITLDAERHSHSVIDMFQLFHQTAEQVFKLQWANDIHHARFMTVLSKIFSNSLAKYCEAVDQKFNREMDEQRPDEQEATAANKTAQGRFMQYAKEAWNTKDKMEPFQFYPEVSCSR